MTFTVVTAVLELNSTLHRRIEGDCLAHTGNDPLKEATSKLTLIASGATKQRGNEVHRDLQGVGAACAKGLR